MAFRNNHERRDKGNGNPVQLANARHLDARNAARCILDRSQFCVPTAECNDCPNNGIRAVGDNTLVSVDAFQTFSIRPARSA